MEILTPQIVWKGYDASALPLGVSVLADTKSGGERTLLAYFNGPTTTDGVARVFVRCVLPSSRKPLPVVVYLPDAATPVSSVDCRELISRGYAAVIADWAGERADDPRYTLYPRSMSYADFRPERLTELPDDMRFNCRTVWAEIAMRALTFAAGLEGVDPERMALIGAGAGAGAALKALAVDPRPQCGALLFPSGAHPEESEGQDYLKYKVALTDEAYAPMIKRPVLMMLASNESDGSLDDMCEVFSLIPRSSNPRLSISARADHSVGAEQRGDIAAWLDLYLRGKGSAPASPELTASCSECVLYYNVKAPAGSTPELYVAQGRPQPAYRNWRKGKLIVVGEDEYIARTDIYDVKAPVYAFATATMPEGGMSLSTPVLVRTPALLGVAQTPAPSARLLYDGEMGTDDWIARSAAGEENRLVMRAGPFGIEGVSDERGDMFTFKPGDKWSGGAEGALLQIMIYSPEAQDAEFIATAPDEDGEPEEFSHTVRLDPCDGWRKLTLRSEDFKSPGAVCPEWPSIVSLGVRSASPVVIASMLWV